MIFYYFSMKLNKVNADFLARLKRSKMRNGWGERSRDVLGVILVLLFAVR
jgi:hypothetical protein